MWVFSNMLRRQIMASDVYMPTQYIANTITVTKVPFPSGSYINDSANGLGSFNVGDYVGIIGGVNSGRRGQVLAASASQLKFAYSDFNEDLSGTYLGVTSLKGGSFKDVMKNCYARLYSGPPPTSYYLDTPTGDYLCPITLNGGTFVAGSPDNGLNFGEDTLTTINRAIDPATEVEEVWSGTAVASGTAQSIWIWSNDGTSSDKWMVGSVGVSGADFNMTGGTSITIGQNISIDSVSIEFVY